MPAPKLATSLPVGSNFMIGATFDLLQLLAPQRSNTHTLLPSRSTSTPIGAPIFRLSESLVQLSSSRYGLGAEFGSCAYADTAVMALTAAMTAASCTRAFLLIPCSSLEYLLWRHFLTYCTSRLFATSAPKILP